MAPTGLSGIFGRWLFQIFVGILPLRLTAVRVKHPKPQTLNPNPMTPKMPPGLYRPTTGVGSGGCSGVMMKGLGFRVWGLGFLGFRALPRPSSVVHFWVWHFFG